MELVSYNITEDIDLGNTALSFPQSVVDLDRSDIVISLRGLASIELSRTSSGVLLEAHHGEKIILRNATLNFDEYRWKCCGN